MSKRTLDGPKYSYKSLKFSNLVQSLVNEGYQQHLSKPSLLSTDYIFYEYEKELIDLISKRISNEIEENPNIVVELKKPVEWIKCSKCSFIIPNWDNEETSGAYHLHDSLFRWSCEICGMYEDNLCKICGPHVTLYKTKKIQGKKIIRNANICELCDDEYDSLSDEDKPETMDEESGETTN